MLIGAHVSAAGGLHNAPLAAAELGLECFQFFSRPPQGGPPSKLTAAEADLFKKTCADAGIEHCYIHTPYVLNFASPVPYVRKNTVEIVRGELDRGSLLGVTSAMTHIGSASKVGEEKGVEMTIEGVKQVLKGYKGTTRLLLEMSAGAGAVIGDTFEEMAAILKGVGDERVGICWDTAHVFASGYDIRTEETLNKVLKDFDRVIGLDLLELSHCNDSKVGLGEKKDRHEHLGHGHIGKGGFKAIVGHKAFAKVNLILETPHDELLAEDIAVLKKLRGGTAKSAKNKGKK
jgi:deoxyribonuclease-4